MRADLSFWCNVSPSRPLSYRAENTMQPPAQPPSDPLLTQSNQILLSQQTLWRETHPETGSMHCPTPLCPILNGVY